MGMSYTVVVAGVGVTAAQSLFEIAAPADAVLLIKRVIVEQSSDTDSEQLRLTIARNVGGTLGNGNAVTPRPLCSGAAASGATVEVNATTPLSGGTSVTILERGFNVINGCEVFFPIPLEIPPSGNFIVSVTAPIDSITATCTAEWDEIGG